MKLGWNSAQLQAITARGGNLLVSAAAGSGKTAVLVERVIRRLTDETRPVTPDRFLIVTFTRAAASEIRTRISAAFPCKGKLCCALSFADSENRRRGRTGTALGCRAG